tara:strand:+ start:2594 stop:4141 length:1548 start_codon:yes stop_codon:yes gene_type:complete
MVKKKTTKKRKGVILKRKTKVKTKKETKDTKQDKTIKLLKAELKKLASQVLSGAKGQMGEARYKKLKTNVMDKFNMVDTKAGIKKMTNNLLKTPYQNIPSQLARDAQANLRTAKQEVKQSIKNELEKELEDPIKQYNKMKKDLNSVIEKYNNGELSIVEVAVAYKSAKKFAKTVGEYLPSASELNSTYRSVKNKLNYLRSWASSRMRSGDTITELQALPSPSPSPSPSPDPPPPPSPSPDPPPPPSQEETPSPAPTEQPTMSKMYDSAKQTIENNNPFIQRTGQALVGLGMLEGTTRLYNSLYRTNRNRDIVRDRLEDAGATMSGRLAQQASQAVLDQLNRENADTVNLLNEAESVIQSGNDLLETTNSRQPLRQRDREIRERQQMGNNLRDSFIIDQSIDNEALGLSEGERATLSREEAREMEQGQDIRERFLSPLSNKMVLEETYNKHIRQMERQNQRDKQIKDETELELLRSRSSEMPQQQSFQTLQPTPEELELEDRIRLEEEQADIDLNY